MLRLVNGGRWERLVYFAASTLLPFFVLAWLSPASIAQMAAAEAKRNVLVLYDEPRELPGLTLVDRGIDSELAKSKLHSSIELYRESLDLTRFSGDPDYHAVREYFHEKYAAKKIDVVIAVMAPSVDFMLKYGEETFPGVPVVFCGLDSREVASRKLGLNFTGALLTRDYKGTADLVLKLLPRTHQFFFIAGTSGFDREMTALARADLHQVEDRVSITYLTDLPLNDTLERVSHLPPDAVVLYAVLFRDGAGETFDPYEVAALVSQRADVPVFGFFDQYMGRGIVGGEVYSIQAQGEEAADLALRILNGEKASNIPVIAGRAEIPVFDWRQLKRWHIALGSIQPQSQVRYREPTFWEQYKRRVVAVSVVIIAQSVLIVLLVMGRQRQRRAESGLRESEERMSLAAEAANLAVWEWDLSTDEVWTTGTHRKPPGRSVSEKRTLESFISRLHVDDRDRVREALKAAVNSGEDFASEFRFMLPDGRLRWATARGRCIKTPDGKNMRFRGVSMDVTAQKDVDDLFRLATESSLSGVVMVNKRGEIILVNSQVEKLFGYRREELAGKSVEILVPERFASQHPAHRAKFLATPTTRAMGAGRELFARRKDGSEFPVEIGLNPIQTPDGVVVLTTVVNISARKAAEEETRRSRQQVELMRRVSLLGEMTASLAHELNQPLAAIVNNATSAMQYLEQGRLDPKQLQEILTDVVGDGHRAYDIMRNVRGAIKKGTAIRGRINLNDVVKAVTHMVQPDTAAQFCKVEMSLARDLPAIEGDPTQIQQVLINLVHNAVDAMHDTPPGRRIVEIATNYHGDGAISVVVRDYGSGISEATRERLFEQFFTTKEEGLGMGLAIVRSIVEAHGGSVAAENANGGGARFHFRLPINQGVSQ
jgi:PAS domain S-box-containing protein